MPGGSSTWRPAAPNPTASANRGQVAPTACALTAWLRELQTKCGTNKEENILTRLRPTSCPADRVHANHSHADRHQSASRPILSYVATPAMSVPLCLRKQANISASHAHTQNTCSWRFETACCCWDAHNTRMRFATTSATAALATTCLPATKMLAEKAQRKGTRWVLHHQAHSRGSVQGAHTARSKDTSSRLAHGPARAAALTVASKQPHHTAQEHPTGRNSVHMLTACVRCCVPDTRAARPIWCAWSPTRKQALDAAIHPTTCSKQTAWGGGGLGLPGCW